MDLKEIAQFLDDNAPAFLATLGTCGNPRVRPIQSPLLMWEIKFIFAQQIQKDFLSI